MSQNKVISLNQIKIACKNCGLGKLCLPLGLNDDDVDKLDAIVKRSRPMHRGNTLFQKGQEFSSIYVVKTGTIKTYSPCLDGNEQVIDFHLPGEVIGLDGIESGHHICSAKALETSAICEIPFSKLEELTATTPALQHQLFRIMSQEITKDTGLLRLLGKSTAEERLAAFLLGLSVRFQSRGFSGTDFNLSMSRQEIGSYLGLALETISRLLTHFQEDGILQVDRKHIQIMDMDRLYGLLAKQNSNLAELRIPK